MTERALRHRFPREQRLGRQRDFARVFARKCTASDALLLVYVDANDLAFSRLGLSVGKGVGGAVIRNRIKRLIREAFRLSQHDLPAGLDIVCVAKPAKAGTMHDYQRSLSSLVKAAYRKYQGPRPEKVS
ncbi:MAG: ribonuclease P protein component [Phycisphaerae bacterium]